MALPKYGRFPVRLWGDPDWRALRSKTQLVGIFLIAYKRNGPWPAARICRHTGIERGDVESALAELRDSPFREYVQTEPRRRRMSAKLRTEVLERDGYQCKFCGTSDRLTIDHIYPVSRGGADDLQNLQTLCHSCNSRKGASIGGLVQG